MRVLFATTNHAKISKYKEFLEEKDIELLTLKDLNLNLDVIENGKNALENAYIKAKAYYDVIKIPTIGMDISLFIEGIPDDKQPGTYVRRVGEKVLTDQEMIDYYTKLVEDYGDSGKLLAKWVCGIVICNENGKKEFSWYNDNFYFVDKPSDKINPGYPLDSISIDANLGKYVVEISEKDNRNENVNEVIRFIVNNIK